MSYMHSVSYFSNYVFSAAPAFAYASKILGGRRAETTKLGTATSFADFEVAVDRTDHVGFLASGHSCGLPYVELWRSCSS